MTSCGVSLARSRPLCSRYSGGWAGPLSNAAAMTGIPPIMILASGPPEVPGSGSGTTTRTEKSAPGSSRAAVSRITHAARLACTGSPEAALRSSISRQPRETRTAWIPSASRVWSRITTAAGPVTRSWRIMASSAARSSVAGRPGAPETH